MTFYTQRNRAAATTTMRLATVVGSAVATPCRFK